MLSVVWGNGDALYRRCYDAADWGGDEEYGRDTAETRWLKDFPRNFKGNAGGAALRHQTRSASLMDGDIRRVEILVIANLMPRILYGLSIAIGGAVVANAPITGPRRARMGITDS